MARCDIAIGRLGALRARLLGAAGVRELLARGSTAAQLDFLRGTSWAEAVPEDGDLGRFELATAQVVLREATRLLRLLEGTRQRALWQAVLDLVAAETVRARLRAPDPDVATEIARLHDHPLAPALQAALPAYQHDRNLGALEEALERAALERALASTAQRGEDAELLQRFLRLAIDLRNAALWLALGPDARLLPGGTLSPAALSRTWRLDRDRPFRDDRVRARVLVDACRREARRRPLSLLVPLAYVLERLDEARQLRLILGGTAFALPGDDLADLLEAA